MVDQNAASGARYISVLMSKLLNFAQSEARSSRIGDAPVLSDLLSQIPPDEEIGSVRVDGAYDTCKCHEAIVARIVHAVIPPRKNAQLWKPDTPCARVRNKAVRSSKYLGRVL